MANVVAARWRAKEGCEDRLAPVIAELIPLACLEPGCPFYQANCSIEDPRLFFGLGSANKVRTLVVRYPGGKITRLTGVAANQILRVAS